MNGKAKIKCANKKQSRKTHDAILHKIFGRKANENSLPSEQAVIIHFTYNQANLDPLHDLERRLAKVIKEKRVGEFDGQEIAVDMTDGFLYMYGAGVEEPFRTVRPALEQTGFSRGAVAKLRFGGLGSGAKEIEIEI